MPWGLTRFQHSGQSHFVTFCCYHRRRLLTTDESCRIFESALERVRRRFRLQVYGYAVMPEHVHLLLSEPQRDTSSDGTAPLKPKGGLNGPPATSQVLLAKNRLSDNVGGVKQFLSTRQRALEEERHFALDEKANPTKARSQSVFRSGTQSDPCISSVTTSIMITTSNSSVKEERAAQSITRCSIAHHRLFRACPRANRTFLTARNSIPCATSNRER